MTISATSCMPAQDSLDLPFKPAQGWILVASGSVSGVRSAIEDYDDIAREARPGVFRVELHPQSNGAVAVLLPDGLPAYDLANMTGWLSAPPDQAEVNGAVAWITAPGSGVKYYLEPEIANPSGDTLIGASEHGSPIRVFLPEAGVSEISSNHPYVEEPRIDLVAQPVTIQVTLDTSTDFGNPQFVIDSLEDCDRRQ